jgi:predicted nucleic acid-binding protein
LSESARVYPIWEGLIAKHAVLGKQANDARLVALMIHHGLVRMLTFNDADFRRFTEIEPVNPFDVLTIPRV